MSQPGAPQSRREARNAAPPAAKAKAPRAEGRGVDSTGGGLLASKPWLLPVALGVGFLLLATGALFAGAAVASRATLGSGQQSVAEGRAVPSEIPAASRMRTCSIAALAKDAALMSFKGAVTNAATGELLFDRGASKPLPQGGAQKVLTAAAALSILGPDHQLSTRVYEGSAPGTIVLVGGGDPTLSRLHSGSQSVYADAPKLDALAAAVHDNYSDPITTIVLDASMWNESDSWDSTWKRSLQTGGTLSEVTALQVDGDRADPTAQTSPRSTDPVKRAGELFAQALGLDPGDVTFTTGTAVTSKPLLAEVKSQPVKVLVKQMLAHGDDTLAETLARVISQQMGMGGASTSLQQVLTGALAVYGVDTNGVLIRDGSGESTSNGVPPAFMAAFLAAVAAGADNLDIVNAALGVAGKSGTLAKRFGGDNAIAKGAVLGTTGHLATVYSIVGIINAKDGTQLSFAFYAVGKGVTDKARTALDTVATGAFGCGDNLANN